MSTLLGDEPLLKENPFVIRRIIEGSEYLIAKARIEIRTLKGKGIDMGRVAAESDCSALGLGDQRAADALAPQIGMDPQQIDEQPAGIEGANQPSADLAGFVAHEDAEIIVTIVDEKRRVVCAERLVDELAIRPRRVLFNAEAAAGRQVHGRTIKEGASGHAIVAPRFRQPLLGDMDRDTRLDIIRRAYAKRIMFAVGATDRRLEAAFAAVPREAFLDRGPWQVVRFDPWRSARGYVRSPSADPVYVYDDVVIAILPERKLNNGQPSLHAWLMANAAPRAGEHIVHIGLGAGYYTAILAQLAGRRGRVTAIEYDPELAKRTARNLRDFPRVAVLRGDGTGIDFAPADLIYVNAGATAPLAHWLDRLREGGRLILPLTEAGFPLGDAHRGAVFRIERRGVDYLARRISAVAIFPCAGGRDPAEEAALAEAFARGGAENVTRLYRHNDVPDADCWLRGEGWCLAYR
jgi:protein-L-isoaspartate(D-aspartate) O-methyltransferase